jgi:fructokinase
VLGERSPAFFAVTLGKDGTLLGKGSQKAVVPSIPIQPVDTTGAGDAFVGAMLYQLSLLPKADIRTMDMEQWIRMTANANKAGARTCAYLGAMEAFRHLNNQIFD